MKVATVELTKDMARIQVAIRVGVSVIDSHPGHKGGPARSDQQLT